MYIRTDNCADFGINFFATQIAISLRRLTSHTRTWVFAIRDPKTWRKNGICIGADRDRRLDVRRRRTNIEELGRVFLSDEKTHQNHKNQSRKKTAGSQTAAFDGHSIDIGRIGRNSSECSPKLYRGMKKVRLSRLLEFLTRSESGAIPYGNLDQVSDLPTQISLYPGESKGGTFTGDTKTAGSVALMLQATLPCLLLTGATESTLILKGKLSVFCDNLAICSS